MRSWISSTLMLALLGIGSAACAAEDGLAALGKFLTQTQSGSAVFTQTVAAPKSVNGASADSAQGRYKVSTGQFAFARPNRFRFDYQKPYAQTIVADGHTLWFYDHDLEQVTASPQAQALQNTPAALLTNARSLADLEKTFTVKNLSAAQVPPLSAAAGLLWVEAKPKTAGSSERPRNPILGCAGKPRLTPLTGHRHPRQRHSPGLTVRGVLLPHRSGGPARRA